jgi:hypothetical protein
MRAIPITNPVWGVIQLQKNAVIPLLILGFCKISIPLTLLIVLADTMCAEGKTKSDSEGVGKDDSRNGNT